MKDFRKELDKLLEKGNRNYCIRSKFPIEAAIRNILQDAGFMMVHICWPSDILYIFQHYKDKGPKEKCEECGNNYSLAFPTAGGPKQ